MKKPGRAALKPSHKPVLVFLVKCLVLWGAALLVVSRFSFIDDGGVDLTIWTLQRAFGLLGQHVERVGSSISAAGTSIEIVSDCSPHMPFLIYAAVILAFPSTWRQRLLGLVFGAVVIHLFNTLRIMSLIW